jgi:hypothetical protein
MSKPSERRVKACIKCGRRYSADTNCCPDVKCSTLGNMRGTEKRIYPRLWVVERRDAYTIWHPPESLNPHHVRMLARGQGGDGDAA